METKEDLRKEYDKIWDKIRYKKISEVESITSEIINILEKHIDDRLFFHGDCEKINFLFKKLKQRNYFYMASDAKQLICLANPKFKELFENMGEAMKLDRKKVCGYSFIKIGNFYKSNKPIEAKFDGKQLDNYNLAVKLIDDKFLNAEQSTYLIYKENELVYAGYYSNTLYDRWFRKQNDILYVWHGIEDKEKLKDDLRNHPEKFSMWLTENPYSDDVNISKAIEDVIIMKEQPIGNKVGKDLEEQKNGAIKVSEILKNI